MIYITCLGKRLERRLFNSSSGILLEKVTTKKRCKAHGKYGRLVTLLQRIGCLPLSSSNGFFLFKIS